MTSRPDEYVQGKRWRDEFIKSRMPLLRQNVVFRDVLMQSQGQIHPNIVSAIWDVSM